MKVLKTTLLEDLSPTHELSVTRPSTILSSGTYRTPKSTNVRELEQRVAKLENMVELLLL